MAFVQIPPDPYPYEALKVYFEASEPDFYYYDRKVREASPQTDESHKNYLTEKAREILDKMGPYWTRAEILVIHGENEHEIRLVSTLYPISN